MPTAKPSAPETHLFTDDGSVPNNPRLPFLIYRGAIDLIGTPDPEDVIEQVFRDNGWGDMWRNGIFPYVHYHSMIHEGTASRAAAPRCASAARQGRASNSRRATSSCCRPAPAISACGRAPTSW